MGTHPIFESDFDCLTDCQNGTGIARTCSRDQRNTGPCLRAKNAGKGQDAKQNKIEKPEQKVSRKKAMDSRSRQDVFTGQERRFEMG